MNKKVLAIFVTLIAVAMLATPIVGMTQAEKGQPQTIEATFELRNPATIPYAGGFNPPTSVKYFGPISPAYVGPVNPDGYKYQVQKELLAWGIVDCGPLGIGKMTADMKFYFFDAETKEGFMLLVYYLEFDGDHGDYEGTLTGNFQVDTIIANKVLSYEGKGIFAVGTGELKDIKIDVSVNVALIKGIAYGEMTCITWGLP